MKTTTIKIRNHKDTGLYEKACDLGYSEEHSFEIFEFGEYLDADIIVDENLNIIGGKIIPTEYYKK